MKVLDFTLPFDRIHKGDDFISRKFKSGPLEGYEMKVFEEDVLPPHLHLEDPNGNIVCAISMDSPEYLEWHVKTTKYLTDEEKLEVYNKLKERASIYLEPDLDVWRCFYYKALEYTGWYSYIRIQTRYEAPLNPPDYRNLPNENTNLQCHI